MSERIRRNKRSQKKRVKTGDTARYFYLYIFSLPEVKAKISKESLENTETSDSLKQEQVKETMENKTNKETHTKKKKTQTNQNKQKRVGDNVFVFISCRQRTA